jgi:sugar lactone lactonase YvrE
MTRRKLVHGLGLAAAMVTGVPACAHATEPMAPWRARFAAIAAGCRQTTPAICRDSLGVLRALLPGHPGVALAFARAAHRAGDPASAMDALSVYARMGMSYDLPADTTFIALATHAGYDSLARRLADNAKLIAQSKPVHRFLNPELLVEDVVWDASKERWLVASIRHRKVIAIDASGAESDFAGPGAAQPWGIFGLALDAKRKLLWAGTAATREVPGVPEADRGRAALVAFDLRNGKVVRRVEVPADSSEHVLGDLTVAKDGTVYVTDSIGGDLYRLAPKSEALEPFVRPREFFSPQGPALSSDGRTLFVADYGRGIARVDVATRAVQWLAQPGDVATAGTDGLYFWNDALIAIQNGVIPHRIAMFALSPENDRITSVRVLERASGTMGEPNHAALVGDELVYIGNSGWDRIDEDGTMRHGATPAYLLRLSLRDLD